MEKEFTAILQKLNQNLLCRFDVKRKENVTQKECGLELYANGVRIDASCQLDLPVLSELVDIVCTTSHLNDTDLCICLIKAITGQQLVNLNEQQLHRLINWLQTNALCSSNAHCQIGVEQKTAALRCLLALLQVAPSVAQQYWELLFHPEHTELLKHSGLLPGGVCEYKESVILVLACLETALGAFSETTISERQLELYCLVADELLRKYYEGIWTAAAALTMDNRTKPDQRLIAPLLMHSLQLLQKICDLCANYAQKNSARLFGLAKEYLQYGINNRLLLTLPQPVHMAQQSYYDSSSDADPEPLRNNGGKISKLRKPRAVIKGQRKNQALSEQQSQNGQQQQQQGPIDNLLQLGNDMHISTSESEHSCSDNESSSLAQGLLHERHRRTKVRLAAIALLGTIARQQERRVLYAYWHVLFPSIDVDKEERTDLLHVGYSDPSVHCRSAALQVGAQLLFGSKQFLNKAESERRRGAAPSFMPFAVSLSLSVRCMYRTLSIILASEASLPVLTQTLKCLAVLIQATPFEQLDMGFVSEFVPYVRSLTASRDCTLQVSALMVMEFLVAKPVLTEEVACLVGMPARLMKTTTTAAATPSTDTAVNGNIKVTKTDVISDEIIDICKDDFEFIESDDDICDNNNANAAAKVSAKAKAYEQIQKTSKDCQEQTIQTLQQHIENFPKSIVRTSWLLRRVLNNLDYDPNQLARVPPTPVRIESLQVLVAMSKHFALFEDQLPRICKALQRSLEDPLPDVRLYAGRCLDALAYQLSQYILETNGTMLNAMTSKDDTAANNVDNVYNYFVSFWRDMLPIIYSTFTNRRQLELPALKVCLCDAISNMGVTIYERLTQQQQTGLIIFLSGCSSSEDVEDVSVRAAAVRTLAVFVLFPTLKTDLVFVENVAELILQLSKDSNMNVRIKALWSLGNISDALMSRSTMVDSHAAGATEQLPLERISFHLLRRLIQTATEACNDNDKVRANAVRSLGNLLRLITAVQLDEPSCRQMMQCAIAKLIESIRKTGNAKVKWNACYAISSLMRNRALFDATVRYKDLCWQASLYPALCQIIVKHANFKVRINATGAILNIKERNDFGVHFEAFWTALIDAVEQSYNMDNYYEYNHRDNLQEQLCLAIAHILSLAKSDDFIQFRKQLSEHLEILRNTWLRVLHRMVPEKSAPLLACEGQLLAANQSIESTLLSKEQRSAIVYLAEAFRVE